MRQDPGCRGFEPRQPPQKIPRDLQKQVAGYIALRCPATTPPVILADSAKQSECGIVVGAATLMEACLLFLIPSN